MNRDKIIFKIKILASQILQQFYFTLLIISIYILHHFSMNIMIQQKFDFEFKKEYDWS